MNDIKKNKYYMHLWDAKTFHVVVSVLRRGSLKIYFFLWFPHNEELIFLFQALDKIKEIAVEIKKDDQE